MTPRDRPEFSDNEPHFIVTAPVETTKGTPKRARPLTRNATPESHVTGQREPCSGTGEYQRHMQRSSAFMDALQAVKSEREPLTPYDELRERYAHGKISLGSFEAEVSVLLRGSA